MAGYSRKCSDEDLQKARADLKELVSRCPIPDEFKFPGDEEEESKKEEEDKKDDEKVKEKKKKLYRMRPEDVRILLSHQCGRFPEHKGLAQLEKEDKEKYKDLRTLTTVSKVFVTHYEDRIAAAQDIARHQLATKGYVTYEATDDEAEDEDAAAPRGPRGSGGRRRHRPGVAKLAGGGVKKLN